MVQRTGLKKAAVGNKKIKRVDDDVDERRAKRKMGGRQVQRKGELNLNNPLIPEELDEDIDDDIAFNSDDEAKYGHFFKDEAPSKKVGKKATSEVKGEFDKLRAYGENEEFEDDFSDDSRDEFDLSEMLDSKEDRKKAKTARRSKREGRKSAPAERLTRESESILGPIEDVDDQTTTRRAAGLHDLLHSAPESASSRRLEAALKNKKILLTDDVDDLVKERTGRAKAREVVAEKLKQYTTVLNVHKEAIHLKFPLQVPDANPVPGTMGSLAASLTSNKRTTPASGLENKMHELLKASGLGGLRSKEAHQPAVAGEQVKFGEGEDDDDDEGEAPKQMNAGYMAKLKSMLSYEIAKRKRFNKIKSKTYRRILRKEKDRDQERRQKALELLNPEAARARLQEKMDKLRAEERATQKHKNTSKWVKHAKQFAKFDNDTKDAIDEQHALRQKLMSKMSEDAGAELEDAADDLSESSEEEMRVDELLAGNKDAESILWQGAETDDAADMTPTDKARRDLLKMGFMTKAKDRSNAQLKNELSDLKEDIRRYHEGQDLLHAPSGAHSKKNSKKARAALEDDEENEITKDVLAEDHATLEEQYGKKLADRKAGKKSSIEAKATITKAAGRTVVGESKSHEKHNVTLKQRGGIRANDESVVAQEENDDIIEDGTEERWDDEESAPSHAAPAPHEDGFAGSRKKAASTRVKILPTSTKRKRDEDIGANAAEAAEPGTAHSGEVISADEKQDMQQYLIARAFAMDDVDEDFLKAKEAQVESIMKPEDKNQSLPGWGEWGGEDERLNSQHKTRVDAKKLERKIQMSALMKARADAQLENVIINHDVDIVPDRHTLHMVPRPFSNPTEFARSMRQPLGPEWNTSLTFKEGTQPRITTTQGVAIDPLDLTSQKKKAKTIRRKLAKKSRD